MKPRRGELLEDIERDQVGEIVRVEHEFEECIVQFKILVNNPIIAPAGAVLSAYNDNIFWDARTIEQCFALAKQKFSYVGMPSVKHELRSYAFDDLSYDKADKHWIMET
jgi:hypothetical protein